MGQQEENALLNNNNHNSNSEPQYVPQRPQVYAYPNFQPQYYTNAYSQVPVFVPPLDETVAPLRYDPYNDASYATPPHVLHHPILQRRQDNMGSSSATIIGVLLGFFFPLLSLPFLCCFRKLRLKHGITIGQVISYTLSLVCVIVIGTMISNQIPATCHGVNSCISDVSNGTNSMFWGDYLVACNTTEHQEHPSAHPGPDGSHNRVLAHRPHTKSHDKDFCELPSPSADMNNLGPQSVSCATCVCDRKYESCRALRSISWTCWIAGLATAFLAIVAMYMNKYYRRIMTVESMSVYRL